MSQSGWQHSRSLTSMARRVAPVNSRAVGLHSTRLTGAKTARSRPARSRVASLAVAPILTGPSGVNSARSMSASCSQASSEPGGTTVPSSSSEIRPCSVS